MGGGDLNFKKSWHPATFKNQERVWKAEQQAIEEQKKADQLRREIEEQREMEDLYRLQEQAGKRKVSNKMDWMYGMGPESSTAITEEREQFLLGKRKVDQLLESKVEEMPTLSSGLIINDDKVDSQLDLQSKFREDPLTAILQREKSILEKMLKNPLKVKDLEKSKSGKKHKKEKKEKYDRDEKHSHRLQRSDRDYEDERESESHRKRREHNHSDRHRRDYDSKSHRHSNRSPSPRGDRSENTRYNDRSRERSPNGHRRYDRSYRDSKYDREDNYRRDFTSRRRDRSRSYDKSASKSESNRIEIEKAEKGRKLKAMMQNADEMDSERKDRLAKIDQKEKEEAQKHLESQIRRARDGDRATFLKEMHHDAYYSNRSEDYGRTRSKRSETARD